MGLSDADARRRTQGEEWSVVEVLAHMIDVDDYYLGQALLLRDQPGAMFSYFGDEAWKREHASPDEFVLTDVLSRLDASHRRVLNAVAGLTEADLEQPGLHPRGIRYTVRDVLLRFPAHDENHEQQIRQIRAELAI